jgi:hypothetical protein
MVPQSSGSEFRQLRAPADEIPRRRGAWSYWNTALSFRNLASIVDGFTMDAPRVPPVRMNACEGTRGGECG